MMENLLEEKIVEIFKQPIVQSVRLQGGCIGEVCKLTLKDGLEIVVKYDAAGKLGLEGRMLDYLATQTDLAVPTLYYKADDLLVMHYLQNQGRLDDYGEEQAADALASLHQISATSFGFEWDSLIAGLPQPNPWCDDWFEFYAQHRLLFMGDQAIKVGKLPKSYRLRLETLSKKLPNIAPRPDQPALLHGDLWVGNVLAYDGQLTGFIDPAIYYGHREMDLAFSTLFNSFSARFYEKYQEHYPLDHGFFKERVDLYNLYPLLVHVRLFGASYVGDVDRVLKKFGC